MGRDWGIGRRSILRGTGVFFHRSLVPLSDNEKTPSRGAVSTYGAPARVSSFLFLMGSDMAENQEYFFRERTFVALMRGTSARKGDGGENWKGSEMEGRKIYGKGRFKGRMEGGG